MNGPADVLIGMDIIGSGDFAVTNSENKTVMTYRIPSVSRIDFTNSDNNINHSENQVQLSRQEKRAIERVRHKRKGGHK